MRFQIFFLPFDSHSGSHKYFLLVNTKCLKLSGFPKHPMFIHDILYLSRNGWALTAGLPLLGHLSDKKHASSQISCHHEWQCGEITQTTSGWLRTTNRFSSLHGTCYGTSALLIIPIKLLSSPPQHVRSQAVIGSSEQT